MDSSLAPAIGVTAGYRHTSRGGVRIQPELVIGVAAEVGAVTWKDRAPASELSAAEWSELGSRSPACAAHVNR